MPYHLNILDLSIWKHFEKKKANTFRKKKSDKRIILHTEYTNNVLVMWKNCRTHMIRRQPFLSLIILSFRPLCRNYEDRKELHDYARMRRSTFAREPIWAQITFFFLKLRHVRIKPKQQRARDFQYIRVGSATFKT